MDSAKCRDHGLECDFDTTTGRFMCWFPREGYFPFPLLPSTLIASCAEFPFAEPTQENCNCSVFIGTIDDASACLTCSFLPQNNTADGNWDIAFDCSNLVEGHCVGYTAEGDCIVNNPNNVTEATPIPNSSGCLNATRIDLLPFSETGDVRALNFVTFDFDATPCPSLFVDDGMRWYALEGTGSCVRATTAGSEFDTVLGVYAGECGDLKCVNDDEVVDPNSTEVEWFSEVGLTYYVLLQNYESNPVGNYTISITVRTFFKAALLLTTWNPFLTQSFVTLKEFDCASNKDCVAATNILQLPFEVSGTTDLTALIAPDSSALACSVVGPGGMGVWFTGQNGASACVRVSTVGSRFDTVIALYRGSCTNLTCVAQNDDSSSLVRTSELLFSTEEGVLYHVFVGGAGNSTGLYRVKVTFESLDSPCSDLT